MGLSLKEEWERFVSEKLDSPHVKQFAKLRSDVERFKYCKNLLQNDPVAENIITDIENLINRGCEGNGKSLEKSQKLRHQANEYFMEKNFEKAVSLYNKSIKFMPHNSVKSNSLISLPEESSDRKDVAAVFARRAEALYELGHYQACLSDLQEVAAYLYPNQLDVKLQKLQKMAAVKIKRARKSSDDVKVPDVAGQKNKKIAHGSELVEISYNKKKGRFLQASDEIRAGDTLVSEPPYAAVVLPENTDTHCDYCFKELLAPFPCQHCCKVLYCSKECKEKALARYHRVECKLGALLDTIDLVCHLSLRILLVTGSKKILSVLQTVSTELNSESHLPGCTSDGSYLGDYSAVYALVTNAELQPVKAMMSYGLNAALLSQFVVNTMDDLQSNSERSTCTCSSTFEVNTSSDSQSTESQKLCRDLGIIQSHEKDLINGNSNEMQPANIPALKQHASVLLGTDKGSNILDTAKDSLTTDMLGCLLLHHQQQVTCNVHAITAIVSANNEHRVSTREQKRIASAIYPTASLLNHACDPDVIVSFVDGSMVVRATHNISGGKEIAHCYGPHVNRMTRKVRQQALYSQYFFTCHCKACRSDEEIENKRLCFSAFACPKCRGGLKLSEQHKGVVTGTCLNNDCNLEKTLQEEVRLLQESDGLFTQGLRLLETVGVKEALSSFQECLTLRTKILHSHHKALAETHDAIARCFAMLGDFKKASHYCTLSSATVEKIFGSSSIEYGHELHKLSQLLFNDRQVKKALSVIDHAARLLTMHYGRCHPDVKELVEMKKCLAGAGGNVPD